MPYGAWIAGTGLAVPSHVVSNAEIAERLGVDVEWITRRTGTDVRHFLGPGERLADLATDAARAALGRAGVAPDELDVVLVGTTSPDDMSPHAATLVAGALGSHAAAIDVSAACTGFLAALQHATGLIEAGRARHVLVIGADALSRFLDLDDRGSAMLFGDGAGAVVVSAADAPSSIGPIILRSDAAGNGLIRLRRGAHIEMHGRAVYRAAVELLPEVAREATEAAGCTPDDVDLFVFHQANGRILSAVAEQLGLSDGRVVDDVHRYANTSAGTLPISLATAEAEGRLTPGARVLLAAFGAGLVYGATLITWGPPVQPGRPTQQPGATASPPARQTA
jgi:3-oxoacyl-[acyl-carrier-protein] synthase-3